MPTLKERPDVTDRVEASRRMWVTPGVRGVGGGRIMRAAAGAKPAGPGGGSLVLLVCSAPSSPHVPTISFLWSEGGGENEQPEMSKSNADAP